MKAPANTQSSSRIVPKHLLPAEEDGAVRPFPYAAVDHQGLDRLRNHRLLNPANPAPDVEAGAVEVVEVNAEGLPAGSGADLEAATSECTS